MKSEEVSPFALRAWRARLASDPLLARGFRPFFLVAAVYVTVGIPLWALMNTGSLGVPVRFTPSLWHAHEMVFGFSAAAAAGFLLTAVPVWTGAAPVSGVRLGGLVALWLIARIVVASPPVLPPLLSAALDVGFPCALLAALGRPLLGSAEPRDRAFLPVLALLGLVAVGFHLATAGPWRELGAPAARVGVDALLLLVVLVGSRIVPSFTQSALARAGSTRRVRTSSLLERPSIVALWVVVLVDGLALDGALAALPKLAAAALLAGRMLGWQTASTRGDPLLWSLHLGFAWLPAGLALDALGELDRAIPSSAGLHALGPGCIATMILAVMSRVALGHTGRAPVAPRGIALAFLALSACAVLRIASTWSSPAHAGLLLASAVLFSAAFATFLAVYGPMLIAPRLDGKPG